MRRALPLLLLGTAAFATVYLVLPAPAAREPVLTAGAPNPSRAQPEAAASLPPPELVDRPVRNVTPAGVTPGPKVTGPLVKLAQLPRPVRPTAPKAPQGPEAAEASEGPAKARQERLFRPVINHPGVIQVASRAIRLADITAPRADERCGTTNWPCGTMARAALRQLIRGRAILCEVPAGAEGVPDPATCSVGNRDIAGWFVAQGWAKAANDRYAEAEKQARAARRGLWGDGVARQPLPAAAPLREAAVQAIDFDPAGAAFPSSASSPDRARAISARVSGTP